MSPNSFKVSIPMCLVNVGATLTSEVGSDPTSESSVLVRGRHVGFCLSSHRTEGTSWTHPSREGQSATQRRYHNTWAQVE